jgi:hypothetical protein
MLLTSLLMTSCSAVRPYQRVYVDDPDMRASANSVDQFEHHVEGIREGAMGGIAGKGSGGCGCN